MAPLLSPANLGLFLILATFLVYVLRRTALPKPIPGIPYRKESAQRILGDIPDLLKWQKTTRRDAFSFLSNRAVELNSPIIQVFIRPFARPWVFIYDARESHDILTRRFKEFDRSKYFGDVFKGITPKFHVHMPLSEEWHEHRRLMKNTMSHSFLNNVAAPQIWKTTQNSIELWQQKARLAAGRPFSIAEDIHNAALSIVWAATFGQDIDPNLAQAEYLGSLGTINAHPGLGQPVEFHRASEPSSFRSIMTLSSSLKIPLSSPFPEQHHWLALQVLPKYISAGKHKDQMIHDQLHSAECRLSSQTADEREVESGLQSALDLIVAEEIKMAKKEGRPADVNRQGIKDELLGFLLAGHETTSTTICWTLKFLTEHQATQAKLRSVLQAYYNDRTPSVEEITNLQVPYFDAVIEECNRCALTVVGIIRLATTDANVLGCLIPAGTDVFMMNDGPGFMAPSLYVDEAQRSKSSQEAKGVLPAWDDDDDDAGTFRPERWLSKDIDGKVAFNPHAGPSHPFGAGPRGCFGRKWAMLELKTMLTLIFLNFELQPIPSSLADYRAVDGITHAPERTFVRLKVLA